MIRWLKWFWKNLKEDIAYSIRKHKAERKHCYGLTTYMYYELSEEDLAELDKILDDYAKEKGISRST